MRLALAPLMAAASAVAAGLLALHHARVAAEMASFAQCLLSGVDRDCLAGWGCTVHVLTPEGLNTKHLKGRMD